MLFERDLRSASAGHRRVFAVYELIYTAVDFGAALFFVCGSVMFLFETWQVFGTWLFIAGSVLFACKPTLRLIREVRLAMKGDEGAGKTG